MTPQIAFVLVAIFVSIALADRRPRFAGAQVEHAGEPRDSQAEPAW